MSIQSASRKMVAARSASAQREHRTALSDARANLSEDERYYSFLKYVNEMTARAVPAASRPQKKRINHEAEFERFWQMLCDLEKWAEGNAVKETQVEECLYRLCGAHRINSKRDCERSAR